MLHLTHEILGLEGINVLLMDRKSQILNLLIYKASLYLFWFMRYKILFNTALVHKFSGMTNLCIFVA